jgi:tRNA(Arg) A34 adenosine deaminase TadA
MSTFKAERDTIAGLGLLASHHIRFDPAIPLGGKTLHAHGFNVHCLVVDNADGEVLALNRNRIYADQNPLQHAEQVALRDAIARLHAKRPRDDGMTIDDYIRQRMFMAPGTQEADYWNVGCTLYNTFDPCGFCAVTLLVCYMKRIAFLFDDKKFDGVYEKMREYFKKRESIKEPLALVADSATPLGAGARLITELRAKVKALEESGTQLVMTLDSEREALAKGAELFAAITPEHLTTQGQERARNLRTLTDIRKLCNIG